MVSHPENGSDSPIGSDRDRGRDISCPSRHIDSKGFMANRSLSFVLA